MILGSSHVPCVRVVFSDLPCVDYVIWHVAFSFVPKKKKKIVVVDGARLGKPVKSGLDSSQPDLNQSELSPLKSDLKKIGVENLTRIRSEF